MNFDVFLASDAESDITALYEYIFYNDSPIKAGYLYDRIKDAIDNLKSNPERGHAPKELALIGVYEYLEIYFKPYRIIYQINKKDVIIHCILDGRRDLEDLLHKRLLQ
ncbi:MAG TPA: plasmid stabilization protein [Fibrobacteres bacterium]|nr:plasmid stabilization protein [Fibrobacterota bacterium]